MSNYAKEVMFDKNSSEQTERVDKSSDRDILGMMLHTLYLATLRKWDGVCSKVLGATTNYKLDSLACTYNDAVFNTTSTLTGTEHQFTCTLQDLLDFVGEDSRRDMLRINWEMLRRQKEWLAKQPDSAEARGLLDFLDTVTAMMVDIVGLPEEEVYGMSNTDEPVYLISESNFRGLLEDSGFGDMVDEVLANTDKLKPKEQLCTHQTK